MSATKTDAVLKIDTTGMYYRDLNRLLREAVANGTRHIELRNVCGQRYIGTDLEGQVRIDIHGIPGNDLGAFMDGPEITVHGNTQDCCGNTMNEGSIVVHGHAGDIIGMSARGGKIFIRDGVGYRAGIHMKEYEQKKPALVIGGTAQDFLGEYMAGGVLVLLGLDGGVPVAHTAKFIGTGMHGGAIYLRGRVEEYQLGKEVGVAALETADIAVLEKYVSEYAGYFGQDAAQILKHDFCKLFPRYARPYGRLYAY